MKLFLFELGLKNFVISSATEAKEFAITDTKLYVPLVILSTKDNIKLWSQLEYDLKRTVN